MESWQILFYIHNMQRARHCWHKLTQDLKITVLSDKCRYIFCVHVWLQKQKAKFCSANVALLCKNRVKLAVIKIFLGSYTAIRG
jgi:hypothetical protein